MEDKVVAACKVREYPTEAKINVSLHGKFVSSAEGGGEAGERVTRRGRGEAKGGERNTELAEEKDATLAKKKR